MPDDVTATPTIDAGLSEATQPPTVDVAPSIESNPTPVVTEGAPAPEPTIFDPSGFSDHLVEVKVNGEVLQVPLSEALNGYSRQADYTRGKQELAERQRDLATAESLQNALERNPQATLQYLAESLGIDFGGTPAEPEYLTPEQEQARALETQLAQVQSFQQQQMVDAEIAQIKATYGDVDERALLQHAVEIDAPNLDVAYTHMKFNELQTQLAAFNQAQEAQAQQRAAAEAAATAAKQANVGLVSGGHGVQGGAVAPASTGQSMTLREALRSAWVENGF
jgi:hypothetical protein